MSTEADRHILADASTALLPADGLAVIQQIAEKCVFPVDLKENGQSFGLTKRELFAAMAMQSIRTVNPACTSQEIAQSAVADADALLKELAK